MAPQLSQRDIDALLGQMGGGDTATAVAPARSLKRYDFRKPDKFSKDHIRALQVLFENYSRLLGTELAGMLRNQVQVRLTSVEQLPYEDYTAQLPNPTVVGLISCPPLPDRMILEISMPLALAMFDRLLGGGGRAVMRPRDVTDIEAALLQVVLQRMLPNLAVAWKGIIEMTPALDELVFSTAYIPAAVPGTAAALVLLEVAMLGITGTVSIAVPYTVLEPVMDKLNTQKWLASPPTEEPVGMSATGRGPLHAATVPITVVLGNAMVPFDELLQIVPGDVIRLDSAPGGEVSLAVGDHRKFTGLPGRLGNRIAVQIVGVLAEEDQ